VILFQIGDISTSQKLQQPEIAPIDAYFNAEELPVTPEVLGNNFNILT
jgi:hypothetical protein